jgi:hypothetical protein
MTTCQAQLRQLDRERIWSSAVSRNWALGGTASLQTNLPMEQDAPIGAASENIAGGIQ